MNLRLRQWVFLASVLVIAGSLTGCVERRFVITSDPPGATVLVNGRQIGATPADDSFVFAGNHIFTLTKDGYETLKVRQDVPARWYEYWPIDFFAENVIPWTIHDVRPFHYKMQPAQLPSSDQVLGPANLLRERGQRVGPTPMPPPVGPIPIRPSVSPTPIPVPVGPTLVPPSP